MRFLEVKSGEFIAIDTIAKIHDVVTIREGVSFSVTTKRGEVYSDVQLGALEYYKLVAGE